MLELATFMQSCRSTRNHYARGDVVVVAETSSGKRFPQIVTCLGVASITFQI